MLRLLRNYRRLSHPNRLLFFQKVKRCLTNNPHFANVPWQDVLDAFFAAVVQYEILFDAAAHGDRNNIRDRDALAEQTFDLLDELANHLESTAARNPGALYTAGFEVQKPRNAHASNGKQPSKGLDILTTPGDEQGEGVGAS